MNKERRKTLKIANDFLKKAIEIITRARDEEQDCLDNMPENLESSEQYTIMETAVDLLDEAIEKIEEAQDSIDEAII